MDWRRFALATGIGALTIAMVQTMHPAGPHITDIGNVWAAARFLLDGRNPYALVGPGRAFDQELPMFYPLPAAVWLMPWSWLPLHVVELGLAGLGAGLLAFSLTRERLDDPRLWVFTSLAFVTASNMTQWSPLLTAAVLMPSLGFLFACKPSIGLALWVAYPSRRAVVFGAALTLVTLVLWPWWPVEWLSTIRGMHFTAPITVPGGFLVLLAVLKWRRPEARLLVALACVPHTAVLYEAVPLFLVVRNGWEGALLSVMTYVVFALAPAPPFLPTVAVTYTYASWMMWLLYLPCVAMVLMRPNVGSFTLDWRVWQSRSPRVLDSLAEHDPGVAGRHLPV